MSKNDRIAARRQTKQDEASAGRQAGFYLVRGIENNLGANHAVQPAYWDGTHWNIIGWDIPLWDSPSYKVEKALAI